MNIYLNKKSDSVFILIIVVYLKFMKIFRGCVITSSILFVYISVWYYLSEKLADIQYNFINLPSRIEFENGHVISYLYDADGIKLRTTHIIGSDTTVTDYCGNVIYENGIPVKLLTEAGYVTLADSKYHYFVQDHLGNNRVVVDQSGNVEEVNHYYPFGGLLSSSVSNAVQPY